jgi:hydroxylamine oxidation protein HaoB
MGGLLLLGWVGWSALAPGPPPYRYELMAEGGIERFPELDLPASPGISISKYELRIDDADKPLAILHVGARRDDDIGPVLLDWQNQIDAPLITITPPIAEFPGLMAAMAKHLPEKAIVLGWWDTTRRLQLFAGIDTPFRENLALPLLVPDIWRDRRKRVEETEYRFWRVRDNADSSKVLFNRFQEALLAGKAAGTAKLGALAGGREAYLVLHISDAYKLGMANPDLFGIGYKDFPSTGNIHVVSGHVKKWLKEKGYESFTIEKRGVTSKRVYFLTDSVSPDTLIAQALPFTTSQPFELEGLSIVYQSGGYWVYKLPEHPS